MGKELEPKAGAAQSTPAGTEGANVAWSIISLLLAGILTWGGIGYLLDRWLGTSLLLPFGILLGAAGAMYLVIRRFGGGERATNKSSTGKTE